MDFNMDSFAPVAKGLNSSKSNAFEFDKQYSWKNTQFLNCIYHQQRYDDQILQQTALDYKKERRGNIY